MGEVDVEPDDDVATRVESASDVPSAASIREARRPASELIRERLVETGDGGRLGRYLILRLLGEGGMGMVFAAYDEDLDRRVAIKLLRTDRGGARFDKSVLLSEAKAMARLSHPNVVQIYDVGEFDEQVFVAMELVNGASLRDWLRERTRGPQEIVRAFVEAGRGLQAVHDAGLVHRDFKPQNVLVSADGRVRVLDFGLAFVQRDEPPRRAGRPGPSSADASMSSASTASQPDGRVLGGTPAFMAPEQHAGGTVDARSDQFSFCVALYHALFGQRPFAGKGDELAVSVLAGELRPPPADSRVPAWLRRVVLRGLAHDPAHRWPSMAALIDALGRDPWRLRLRVLAGLGVVLALAGALGAVAYYRAQAEEQAAHVCAGGPERLAGVWGPERRAAAQAAFRATGVGYAEDTWSKVQARLDSFGEGWVTADRGACEDHRSGELSGSLYDRAVACLDAGRRDLGALAQALATADAAAVEKAVKAAERLPRPERCVDREALLAAVRPPDDPDTAAAVDAIRDQIALIRADILLSRTQRCDELPALGERAGPLEYRPLLAELAAVRGACAEVRGDYAGAAALLRGAFAQALAAGDDASALEVSLRLAHILAFRLSSFAEANTWLDLADALVERAGGREDLRARVLIGRSGLALTAGKPSESLAFTDQALAILERSGGPPTTEVAIVLNNRAAALIRLGDRGSVTADFERALAIYRETLGPEHPDTVLLLTNVGNIRALSGDFAGAEAIQREALALKERLLGPEHPDLAVILTNLGAVHERLGDYPAAQAVFERALAIREKALGPENPATANSLTNLADLLNDRGLAAEALPLLRRALAIREKVEGVDHPQVASVLARLGRSELMLGREKDARRDLERAVAIHAATKASTMEASYAAFYLARAQWATARTAQDRAKARATAEEALATADRASLAKEVAALEAWLASLAEAPAPTNTKKKATKKKAKKTKKAKKKAR